MTDERKQYLASISKEERAIREEISYHKDLIKSLKDIFNCDDGVIKNSWKFAIAKEKTIIKSLKKQLPAPRKTYHNEYLLNYCLCPICLWYANHERCYCPQCGQKLR